LALTALWCGDRAGIVFVAESTGKKESVAGAIAQKTQHHAALFIEQTELLKTAKVLFLIGLTYSERKHSHFKALDLSCIQPLSIIECICVALCRFV